MLSFCGHFPQKEFRYEYFAFFSRDSCAAAAGSFTGRTGGAGALHGQRAQDRRHRPRPCRRLAAKPEADTTALERMRNIVETEKHRVAPNCANCTMRCGNTDNYDLARLWNAPAEVRTLKLELLAALFALAQRRSTERIADEIRNDLFVLAEDWDITLLSPIVPRAQELCRG